MVNPSKMLGIFIVFYYFIRVDNVHTDYSEVVQNCINLMLHYDILFVEKNEFFSEKMITTYYQLEDTKLIPKLKDFVNSELDEPLLTYVKNFVIEGSREPALSFCERQ
ncbi:uncharacterized protein LOC132929065 [Rhopalosiphum padi]|uniref:uncharacterized protein LOC132929065 n=1 Tax=Rhopalosiphum padi TaxID=40932 RepID=UPI00298E3F1D|nr:uncharacterized protein LOC132929065 [Rhopalosiphum padi]